MNPRIRALLVRVLLLGAGILILYLAFRGQDLTKLSRDIRGADYRYVAASITVLLLSHFLRAVRWKMLIKTLGYAPGYLTCFCAVMIAYLANLAVPRLGELSRCSVLYRTDKVPVDELIGTVITERIADVLMLGFLMIGVLVLESNLIVRFVKETIGNAFLPAATENNYSFHLLFGLGLVIVTLAVTLFIRYRVRILRLSLVKRVAAFFEGIMTGIRSISALQGKGWFIVLSISIWLLYALSTFLVFFALNATSRLNFPQALYTLAAGSIGMVAPVQGGIGTYHFMVTRALILLGVSSADGLAYATLNHSSQLLLFLFAGSFALGYIFLVKSTAAATPY